MKTKLNGLLFFLLVFPLCMIAQSTVQGTVTEQSSSLPLPSVNVIIKDTSRGTATDFDGRYQVNVNNGDVLVFSYIGFIAQEIIYNGQQTINVNLVEDPSSLDEVVVIGYGSVKKKDLTGSVEVITSKDFNKGSIQSAEQLLRGKAAGVRITSSGGQPDASPNIRIRGGTSLGGKNDPLIVIDGVPMDNGGISGVGNPLSLINPNDIESFSILKDASATAIYGSRASNGVLIITTKKGTSGEVKYNFSASTSISNIGDDNYVPVMDSANFVRFISEYYPEKTGLLGVPVGSVSTNENVSQIIDTPDGPRAIYDTNWQDVIYRTAINKDYNFGVRANLFKKIPFRASVGYNESEGVVKENDYERVTASLRLTPKLFDDHLKIDFNAKGTFVNKSSIDEGGALGGAISMDPTKPVYDSNSIFGGYYSKILSASDTNLPNGRVGSSNPLALLEQRSNPQRVNRILGSLELDYKFHFLPELRAVTNFGLEASRAKTKESFQENALATYTLVPDPNEPTGTYIFNPGVAGRERQHITNTTWESYLDYAKDLDGFINSYNVQAGYAYQNFKNDGNRDEFRNDEVSGVRIPNIDTANPNNRYFSLLNLQSFFGRSNINLGDKYLVTLSMRADGSSFFTEENRWGYFPSAALAWKLKEESFLQNVNVINDLKVRLGWGKTGNQDVSGQVGFFPSIPVFEIGSPNSQFIEGVTLYNAKEFNPDLTWEKTTTYNVGLDFDIFKNSFLSGSFDIFKRETTDLLVVTNVPPGQALSDLLIQNVGSTDSKGFELGLNLNPISTDNFAVSLNGNISYNKNEVTDLKGIEQISAGGGLPIGTGNNLLRHAVGEQAGSAWVLKQVYDTDGSPILGSFVDLNGDNKINEEDRYYRAIQPNWTFGFGLNMNYKNWDLGASFRGQLDGEVYNSRRLTAGVIQNAVSLDQQSLNNTLDYYSGEADLAFTEIRDPMQYSDYFLEKAAFLRCENIVLGYTLPNNLFKNTTIKLYGAVNNAFIITNYSGQDPENFGGIDTNFYPRATVYNVGVNIDF
ncbi:SusC/RagA family TonB-linked outer membrane protein [Lacinutrix sp. MEBiC02595]